jgi:hypothetical protein
MMPNSLALRRMKINKSFCGGSRGAVFSKRAPLAAGGKVFSWQPSYDIMGSCLNGLENNFFEAN